jgi:hypothetical protein
MRQTWNIGRRMKWAEKKHEIGGEDERVVTLAI